MKGALRRGGDAHAGAAASAERAVAEVRAEFPDWTITDTETEDGRRWWASRGAPTSTILNRDSDLSASSPEALRSKLRAHR
ncbi:hypothetical protein [Spirillospora sp. NBC_01491]|uniref:hypothetical protein n=1 Tax=Spirillospora sp. NBC_01491 TaxID=2976007 RepID=UPI002E3267CE|nr:hypothetical protein [Spirillospora sp. NBC_01491]